MATHTDRSHIHNHIVFNSTSLDCTRKFRDFHLSWLVLSKLSDMICLEHKLSVITPKPYRERTKYQYPERLSIWVDESRLAEIAVLRGHILNYVKTRDIYQAYKASGYSKTYFESHRQALTIHKAAKEAFNQRDLKKLPRIRDLNAEYAQLLERKKKNYAEYRQQKAQMQDWLMAQKIVSVMLDEKEQKETEIKRQEERKTPEHGQ